VRGTVVTLYARAARNWNHAPAEIARGLREARQLHSRERRFVADALHGLTRMRRRLAFSLGLDAGEHATPSPEALYLAWLAGAAEDAPEPAAPALVTELERAGLAIASLQQAPERLRAIEDPVRRLAITHSYPDWLVDRLLGELGEEAARRFLVTSNHRARLCARANRLKNDRAELALVLQREGIETRPIALAPDALELLSHQNAYGLSAFREGRFELQDTASQLIGEVVAPPPRGRVLDFCAGAGGKTLHLSALLGGAGRVTSCDVSAPKLEELRKRARRAGCSNVEAHEIDRGGAPLDLGAPYDRVLVDAPCTGMGVLRRNPEARWRLTPKDALDLPIQQLAILHRASAHLAADGRLIYATCSTLRAENDEVVDRFLSENPRFERVLLKEILGKDRALQMGDGAVLRTSPAMHDADGFFAAVLRRRDR